MVAIVGRFLQSCRSRGSSVVLSVEWALASVFRRVWLTLRKRRTRGFVQGTRVISSFATARLRAYPRADRPARKAGVTLHRTMWRIDRSTVFFTNVIRPSDGISCGRNPRIPPIQAPLRHVIIPMLLRRISLLGLCIPLLRRLLANPRRVPWRSGLLGMVSNCVALLILKTSSASRLHGTHASCQLNDFAYKARRCFLAARRSARSTAFWTEQFIFAIAVRTIILISRLFVALTIGACSIG